MLIYPCNIIIYIYIYIYIDTYIYLYLFILYKVAWIIHYKAETYYISMTFAMICYYKDNEMHDKLPY